MIIEEIFYGIKCDRCNEIHNDGEHSYWNDSGSAMEMAFESEWIEHSKKHYCPNCHDYNDVTDEDTPKPDFPKHFKDVKKFIDKMILGSSTIEEDEERFLIKQNLYNRSKLELFEENYIRNILLDKLISLEYKKHERYTNYYTLSIKIKK